ncbi:MAG TPA: ABC transporter ATP-binding protein [Nocardioides sp.]|uniref:ABC transporter ATP-binding protein n=1 Tax=Nocardioides sp. TaxID=35761 RepID=UPI002E37CEB7|nr:ABC transporter ATP-binding protein [Nocardioides sp.]HEX3929940.1 ABC transporter ATP-binding protein [Nocardioides sp.]
MATSPARILGELRARPATRFFRCLTRSVPGLAAAWWLLLLVRALVPAGLAIATGLLVGRVQAGSDLTAALAVFGVVFVASQVSPSVHQVVGALLGHHLSSVLNDRLMAASLGPDGVGHLERGDLTNDLTTARDFDLGWTGPPMFINMDFIAQGLVMLLGGIASSLVLVGFAWWAPPLLLLGWGSTHWLLRESGVWRDRNTDEVKAARRHTDYAYDLATEPAAAKEVRLFGLAPWLLERFTGHRLHLHQLQYDATRLRERSLAGALVIVLATNALLFGVLAHRGYAGSLDLRAVVTYAGAGFGSSAIAFGGLSWALDGAAAPVVAIERLEVEMARAGALTASRVAPRPSSTTSGSAAPEIRFRDVTFTYPTGSGPVLEHLDLTVPAGASLAIVGQNGAGKTTLAKLLCRLYDPDSGSIEIDGVDLRELDLVAWRSRLAAVFQDFVRYELPLRDNVAPLGADTSVVEGALEQAGALGLAELDAPLAKGYPGGVELSGGQWQRVALARAIAKVHGGASAVLLDEPTAMLDVRGESEIFRRVLGSTAAATTVLVSHRFSTVRQAELICVVEQGRALELGTHDELMALRGRYFTMYDLQASRFHDERELDEHGEELVHDHL